MDCTCVPRYQSKGGPPFIGILVVTMFGKLFTLGLLASLLLVGSTGCHLVLPTQSHMPVIRNPFPQLSKVAVAPFFNHSDEPTLDSRDVSLAYFAELQGVPGFEVVPLNVVEEAIIRHQINLNGPGEARRLAKILGVDAVVVGAITDYWPYYPPRCGLRVEWYTANPGFHEIPAGYGLPWNTPQEEFIPDSLVYESQMALARSQMASQSPDCDSACQTLPPPPMAAQDSELNDPFEDQAVRLAQANEELPYPEEESVPAENELVESDTSDASRSTDASQSTVTTDTLRMNWPDPSELSSPQAPATQATCIPHHGPVLSHTRIYRGTDPELTDALKSYVYYRDDVRFGGWESYLQRSDDFIRFCCHKHIAEMLAARGGSRKTRVVWRWPDDR